MRPIVVLLASILTACGGRQLYDGPPRAATEVARLLTEEVLTGVQVGVASCDGRSAGMVTVEWVDILPGQHTCRVICRFAGRETDYFDITFSVEAGRTYRLDGETRGDGCAVIATDLGPTAESGPG